MEQSLICFIFIRIIFITIIIIFYRGVHIVVATPGRLTHLLEKGLSLKMCHMLCIDEANSLNDQFFCEEISKIMTKLPKFFQTLLLSTMPIVNIPQIVLKSLINTPIVVQGSPKDLNTVKQEFEIIESQNKLQVLLGVLQKTEPPVLIFTYLKEDVDLIAEYLLLKGLKVVSLHSDKIQAERIDALKRFNTETEILVATDIASKVFF